MVCRVLGLPPSLSAPSYSEYNKELAKLCSQQAEASFLRASEELHRLRGVSNDTIIDVIVTCDGTWSKRGFTANYGVVVVISSIALHVLDSPMWPNIIGYMEPNILFLKGLHFTV